MKQRIFVAIALGGVVAVCLGLRVFERARAPIRTNSDSVSDFAEPPEPTALAESFLDVSAAISLDNHSRRSPIDQSVPRLEIVKVPLRHFSSVPHDGSVCSDVHPQIDHLLLLVRRAKNDSLSEAGVIGFLRLQASVTGLMCGTVIESADPSIAYVVLAKKVDGGLNPIVCAVDCSLGDSCKVGDLNSLKPSLWPNGLRIVSQPREPIRFQSQFNAIVTGSYVQDGSDCRIEMEFRDGSGCGRLAGYSYSFQTDEWVALQNRGIWKLDDGSTEVIHVLPVDQWQRDRVGGSEASRRCLAIVRQTYRYQSSIGKRLEFVSPAFWVVEFDEDCDLNSAAMVGVIHPIVPSADSKEPCFHATKTCLISRENGAKSYLLLAGFALSAPEVWIFELDRDQPPAQSPLALDGNSKNWPSPLQVLRTERLPYGGGGGSTLDGLYNSFGSRVAHDGESCVVIATVTSYGNNNFPTKVVHGIDLKRNAAITVSIAESEMTK